MPEIDNIFELIQSLDQSEKRHFKIYAKRHVLKGENQYLRLFDILCELKTYNEAEIKKRLGNTLFAQNLSSSKNYLYNLLLKSLRAYHAGKTIRTNLHELWLDTNLLIEKGLLKQAAKLIRKAKKLAIQYHYDIPLQEILLMERKLIRRYASNRANELILESQQQSAAAHRRTGYHLKMLDLYEKIFLNYRNLNEARQSLLETVNQAAQVAQVAQQDELPFEATMAYHYLCFYSANLVRDYEKANYHLKELIALQEMNPVLIEEDQERYVNTLNNYLNNCFNLKQMEEFFPILQKMQAIQSKSFNIQSIIFNHVYYLKMLYYLVRQEYREVIAMVPAVEEGLHTYAANITKSRQLTFFYNIAIAFFLEKDYQSALQWINRILNEPRLEERQDIQSQARIFQIVLHYELGNQGVVEYLIESANRYLRRKDKKQSAEYLIANSLKQALYADKAKGKTIFEKLAHDLEDMKGLEEIKIWVASKQG